MENLNTASRIPRASDSKESEESQHASTVNEDDDDGMSTQNKDAQDGGDRPNAQVASTNNISQAASGHKRRVEETQQVGRKRQRIAFSDSLIKGELKTQKDGAPGFEPQHELSNGLAAVRFLKEIGNDEISADGIGINKSGQLYKIKDGNISKNCPEDYYLIHNDIERREALLKIMERNESKILKIVYTMGDQLRFGPSPPL
jgi:hypothetical protein